MRALCLTLIILAIACAGSGCASVHLPPYTINQETSDTIVGATEIGAAVADAAATGYAIDKVVTGHK